MPETPAKKDPAWLEKLFSQRNESGIVPALDGLRAVSILLVMVGHLQYQLIQIDEALIKNNPLLGALFYFAGRADLGVDIFFVISGFIITTRLLKEAGRSHKHDFSLKNFYIRRSLRILPACYSYLTSLALFSGLALLSIPGKEILAAGFFVWNFLSLTNTMFVGNWFLAHTWSLCVEEHYYLIWPLCLKALKARGAAYFALAAIILAPLGRLLAYRNLADHNTWDHLLPGSMDFLMCGSLVAIASGRDKFEKLKAFCFRFGGQYLAFIYVFVLSAFLASRQTAPPLLAFTLSALAIAITIFLVYVVEHPNTPAARLLNNKALTHIGVISYSLYLWQELFITPLNKTILGTPGLNFLFALIASEISYHTIEKYFLSLRSKLKI